MKQEKEYSGFRVTLMLTVILVLIIIWAAIGIFQEDEPQEELRISVIVDDSMHSKWTAFQQGLEQASRENNVDLNYITTSRFENEDELNDYIEQIKEDKSDGLILQPLQGEGISDLKNQVPNFNQVIFVESNMSYDQSEESVSRTINSIEMDPKKTATALALEITNTFGFDLEEYNLKILSSHPDQIFIKDTIEYIYGILSKQNCNFLKTERASDENMKYLNNNLIDIVIAMDDSSLSLAARELAARNHKDIILYGIGTSETNIYYLDQNIISAMIIPNHFRMGYEAITSLTDAIRNHKEMSISDDLDFVMVHPKSIYDSSIERKIFPADQ